MLPHGQCGTPISRTKKNTMLSEVKNEQVRSGAGTAVRADFLHCHRGSLPPSKHELTRGTETNGVLRVSRREYRAMCEGLWFSVLILL